LVNFIETDANLEKKKKKKLKEFERAFERDKLMEL
jgi:hypothetical protein